MKRGLVLGKFMPPHAGHFLLFDFARRFADRLTILVCSRDNDPIPGALRQAWIAEMLPDCRVEHFTESALPADLQDQMFWQTWREHIRRHHPEEIDYLITPEDYGRLLAEKLGARHVPAPDRLSVAGTDIRNDPFVHWASIPDCVRPFFLKRVCVRTLHDEPGPTLAERLAEAFGTLHVPAYDAAQLTDDELSRARSAANKAGEYRANRVVFLVTDDGHGDDETSIDLYIDDAGEREFPVPDAHHTSICISGPRDQRLARAIGIVLREIPALAPYLIAAEKTGSAAADTVCHIIHASDHLSLIEH
jgi:HTH-type transcriptional regulator, transcriptional repressor of NAD biosynthesis genes